jgi:hypothetical protein
MRAEWVRAASRLLLYGYVAKCWHDNVGWRWHAMKEGGDGPRASGETKIEASARQAARRWILSQPDAKAAHAEATRLHWNGRPFDGSVGFSSSVNFENSDHFKGACGSVAGRSTNYPGHRAKINCTSCLDALKRAEAPALPLGRGC